MPNLPLDGKKIAIIVESEYIPEEILAYQKYFGERLGANVQFVSRLIYPDRPNPDPIEFRATTDTDAPGQLDRLRVETDFGQIDPSSYAAVLMAANYCSVRLRYSENGEPRDAPAVRFFAKAMANIAVVKGALCHGLWILTPMSEVLKDRSVICHPVVLADVRNAGGVIKDDPSGVWIDDDLVTGKTKHEATRPTSADGLPPYIQAIYDQILKRSGGAAAPSWKPADVQAVTPKPGRRVLIVLSERGYWGEELLGPLEVFEEAKYEVVYATPNGKRPGALPPSMDPDYIDPPLGRSVTSQVVAAKVRELDNTGPNRCDRSKRLDRPVSLAATFPERPYWSAPNYLRRMEAYYKSRQQAWDGFVARFDAVVLVGGSGPIVDLVNNQRVHDLILGFYTFGKPIAAECYAVTCLVFAREVDSRRSLIWGKHVTGHCIEYDYKDGTGFLDTNLNMGPPPYPLEYLLRDATGEWAKSGGGYHGNVGHETSVIVDYPFITGRSTPDSYLTGQKVVEVLDRRLRKFGWGPAVYAPG